MEQLSEENPELAVHLSSAGAHALSYSLAGRDAESNVVLDRCEAVGVDALPFDAEWLPNAYALLEAAVRNRHSSVAVLVDVLRPYAELVAFEGIGAGIHGPVARSLARGCSVLGRDDEAVDLARGALEISTRAGGLLAADAMRTLAECLEGRGAPGDTDEAGALHARADDVYRAAGASSSDPGTQPGDRAGQPDPRRRRQRASARRRRVAPDLRRHHDDREAQQGHGRPLGPPRRSGSASST